MTFAKATGVVHRTGTTYTGVIQPGWDIFGVANGGYVMSIAARAMANVADERDLVAINGHFTNPGRPGPVTVEVKPVKIGRGLTTLRADVTGNDKILLVTTASFADSQRALGNGEIIHASPPNLPPPDECVRAMPSSTGPLPPPFMGKVHVALHPDDATALGGQRTGVAQIRGRDPQPRGWLKCKFSTRFVTGGLLEEDSEIWDEYGNLVAQSRQLALVPR